MDSEQLIISCRKGDRNAMATLYRLYSGRMLAVIKHYVRCPETAEDILHDGFLIVFQNIDKLRDGRKLEWWMATIMKNLSLKYLASQNICEVLDEQTVAEDVPPMEQLISLDLLSKLIDRLPDGYRQVFKLAVLENKSHKEIGEALGIAPHSSSSQLYRARQMLRRLVDNHLNTMGVAMILLGLAITVFYVSKQIHVDDMRSKADVSPTETSAAEVVSGLSGKSVISKSANKPKGFFNIRSRRAANVAKNTIADADEKCDGSTDEAISDSVDGPELVIADIEVSAGPVESVSESLESNAGEYILIETTSADRSEGWTVGISSGFSLGNYDAYRQSDFHWSGGSGDVPDVPDDDGDKPSKKHSNHNYDDAVIKADMPVVAGVSVGKRLSSRVSVETGLAYTYMHTHVSYSSYRYGAEQDLTFHTLGIPVKACVDIWANHRWSMYASAGVSVDFPLGMSDKKSCQDAVVESMIPDYRQRVQFSCMLGVGLQYRFNDRFSLYVEPSYRYNFRNGSLAPTYWRVNPSSFTLPIGFRFVWK